MRIPFALLALLSLGACGMENHANTALQRKNIVVDAYKPVPHCYGYGCVQRADIPLTEEDWAKIKLPMLPPTENAAAEREKIKKSIAVFEQIMGEKAGTKTDKAGTFRHMGAEGLQQDCVDESMNTTIYLQLLKQKNLLLYHNVSGPTVRLPIIHAGRWPHQTAVITEKETGQSYVVDSWFHDNGEPPEIVTLEQWKDGWKPNRDKTD